MMAESESIEEMKVTGIEQGTVIDHIESAATFEVANLLDVAEEDNMVLVGMNLESDHLDHKGLIKIENRKLTPDEVNKIALIAPQATLNIITDYRVTEKFKVQLPDTIERIVKCFNPRCVTNKQDMDTSFEVLHTDPPGLRCTYCERVMRGRDILLK
ncbi:MAG: aspartate carbamoyltransferase regulatory subunit [Planctomycetota bacterium]